MKEIKAKKSFEKMDNQDLEKVSGGRVVKVLGVLCDNCGCRGANPVHGGHLCNDCLTKMKETLSPSEFREYISK